MYEIGDTAFYGTNGICKIKDIKEAAFHGESQLYYVLESTLYPSLILYHPVHGENSKLHKIVTPELAQQILDVFKNPADEWPDRNTLRSQNFKAVVASDDHLRIAQFLNTILRKQLDLIKLDKKLAAQDTQMMQQISTILYDELAISLKVSKEEIAKQVEREVAKG